MSVWFETTLDIEEGKDTVNLFATTFIYVPPVGNGGSGLLFIEYRIGSWASDWATALKNTMAYSGRFVVLVWNAMALPWDHTVNAVLSEAHFIRLTEVSKVNTYR